MTEVRQRTQQEGVAVGAAKGDPLYDIHRLLVVGEERLTASARRRIDAALAHPDGNRLRRGRMRLGSQFASQTKWIVGAILAISAVIIAILR